VKITITTRERGGWWRLTIRVVRGQAPLRRHPRYWRASVSSYRNARRQERARQFGRRHPRLSLVLACLGLAGYLTICAAQIGHGTYLGPSWLIAAAAGIAGGAALSPAALIASRRSALGPLQLAWIVLTAMAAWSIRFSFPAGRSSRPQAVINVVHAALLGYEAVTTAAIVVLMIWVLARLVHSHGWRALPYDPGPPLPRQSRRPRGWPTWVLAGSAAGLVACVILAGVGGSDSQGAASRAAGAVGLMALVALGVAGPAALYRWYRSRRPVTSPQSPNDNARAAGPAGQENWS